MSCKTLSRSRSLMPVLFIFLFSLLKNFAYSANIKNFNTKNFIELGYMTYIKVSEVDNDVTGTGNKLKDIAYISKCVTMQCKNLCCMGSIENMNCGNEDTCQGLRNLIVKKQMIKIVLSVIFFYVIIPIFWIIINCLKANHPDSYEKLNKILLIYTNILLPPLGIISLIELIFCKKKKDKKNLMKIQKPKIGVLFHLKQFQVDDFQRGISPNSKGKDDEFSSINCNSEN
jgi:hypothetical protein